LGDEISDGQWVLAAKQDTHCTSVSPALGLPVGREFPPQADCPPAASTTMAPSSLLQLPPCPVRRDTAGRRLKRPVLPRPFKGNPGGNTPVTNGQEDHGSEHFDCKKKATECTETSLPGPPLTPESVFREYSPRIYRLALRLVGNETDAEDVASEVLLQVVRKLDTFRGESSLATWLHRVTVNAALAVLRKRATLRERHLGEAGESVIDAGGVNLSRRSGTSPEEQVQRRELSWLIEQAIEALPPMYREVFVLADIDNLTNADIGQRLDLSLPAVKSRLHRARLFLRQALGPHFGQVP
jgi:RNA polymerase sigma-70 factor, ECF subfamily